MNMLFDPQAPWKQKRIKDYEMRELQEQIFDHGKLVYTVPSTEEVKITACSRWTRCGRKSNGCVIRTGIMSIIPVSFMT